MMISCSRVTGHVRTCIFLNVTKIMKNACSQGMLGAKQPSKPKLVVNL